VIHPDGPAGAVFGAAAVYFPQSATTTFGGAAFFAPAA